MDLFINAPRSSSCRPEPSQRNAEDPWVRSMQEQYEAHAQAAQTSREGEAGSSGAPQPVDGQRPSQGLFDTRPRRADAAGEARDGSLGGHRPTNRADVNESYSVAQESYREELAFHRGRVRRRRIVACARVIAFIVLVPVALLAVFIGSYALTCVLNGATPEEVLELLGALPARVEDFIEAVIAT